MTSLPEGDQSASRSERTPLPPLAQAAPASATPSSPAWHFDTLGTLACVLLVLLSIGFAAFRFAPVLPVGASRNVDKAFFSSVNLVTLTGFPQSFAAVSEYPRAGLWLIALLSFASALTVLVGSGVFLARVAGIHLAASRVAFYSATLLIVCVAAGLIAGPFDAVSAATGLGLLATRSPSDTTRTLLVTISAVSGVGPILLLALLIPRAATRRRCLLGGCWIALVASYLLGLILLYVVGVPGADASLAAIDTRSLGSGAVPPGAGGSVTGWVMDGLMLLGAAPGGVAGGLSVMPIVILIACGWDALRGRRADPILGVAVAWVLIFFAALAVLVLALATTQPQLPGDRMLFLAISALCNVGLSHDPVSLSREGLYQLSGAMLLGRILPLSMLCWMAYLSDRCGSNPPEPSHA